VPVLYDSHGLKVYESYKMGGLPSAKRPFYMIHRPIDFIGGRPAQMGGDIPPYIGGGFKRGEISPPYIGGGLKGGSIPP
jgi:hypothetical protein